MSDVYILNPLEDPRWGDLLRMHPKASVFHTAGWLRTLHQTYGYEPIAFTTSSPQETLDNAIVFSLVRSWITGQRIVSLPFSDHCELLLQSSKDLDLILRYLRDELPDRRWKYVEIRPLNGDCAEQVSHVGFHSAMSYYAHCVDLKPDLTAIFKGFDKNSVQRRINHAERSQVSEKCGRSKDLLDRFYELMILTRKRHYLPPQPYVWFQNLLACLGENAQIRVAYDKEGTAIAAILTLHFKDVVIYKYGASDERYKRLGATPLLLWRAIQDAKANGATEFDLGRSEENNPGLIAFKDKWARVPTRLVYWRCPPGKNVTSGEAWTMRLAKRAFAHMPNRLLTAAGRTFYRHVG